MVGHKLGEFGSTRSFSGHTPDKKAAAAPAKQQNQQEIKNNGK